MPTTIILFDPPVDAGLYCRHCGDLIIATGQVYRSGELSIKGLREYEWTHKHGAEACRRKTTATPYDAWVATERIEQEVAARLEAADRRLDEEEAGRG